MGRMGRGGAASRRAGIQTCSPFAPGSAHQCGNGRASCENGFSHQRSPFAPGVRREGARAGGNAEVEMRNERAAEGVGPATWGVVRIAEVGKRNERAAAGVSGIAGDGFLVGDGTGVVRQ
jgi:hypothetical protein